MRRREFLHWSVGTSIACLYGARARADTGKSCIAYQNPKAMAYASAHCNKQENSCGVYLTGGELSDCAHFIAHCLNAGGLVVKRRTGDQLCPLDLAVRNVDIDAHLAELAVKYKNVKPIAIEEAIVGDIGFLLGTNKRGLLSPTHAFMVKETKYKTENRVIPYFEPPIVWAHSAERCPKGERMDIEYRQYIARAYRLEDCQSEAPRPAPPVLVVPTSSTARRPSPVPGG